MIILSKPTVHITTGLPASGKSTFAKSLGLMRFNLDDLRLAYGMNLDHRDLWTREREEVTKEAMIEGAIAAVDRGMDIVLDNTFLTPKTPKSIRERMAGKATFKVHSFLDVPIETCIERDARREGFASVGESVIRKLAKNSSGARKNGWVLDDDWMNLWPDIHPAQMNSKNPFTYVCDLDGTLAKHVARGPFELHKLGTDELNYPLANLLHAHYMNGGAVVLLSGRDEGEARDLTIKWLNANRVNYNALFMRPAGDVRPDYLVKYELFKKFVEPDFYVELCFDDRDQCVALWRQLKLATHQVNYGKF